METKTRFLNGAWTSIPEAAPEPVLVGEDGVVWTKRECRSCGYLTLEPVARNPAFAICNQCFSR